MASADLDVTGKWDIHGFRFRPAADHYFVLIDRNHVLPNASWPDFEPVKFGHSRLDARHFLAIFRGGRHHLLDISLRQRRRGRDQRLKLGWRSGRRYKVGIGWDDRFRRLNYRRSGYRR